MVDCAAGDNPCSANAYVRNHPERVAGRSAIRCERALCGCRTARVDRAHHRDTRFKAASERSRVSAPNTALELTPLRIEQDRPDFETRFGLIAFPIKKCGAAQRQAVRWQNQRNEHATTTGDRRTRRWCRRHGAGPNGARLADIACSSRLSSDRATSWRASGHCCS